MILSGGNKKKGTGTVTTTEQNIKKLQYELNFIARMVSNMRTDDFDAQHEIQMAIDSAKLALLEIELDAQEATEEIPAGVRYPEAA